MDRRSFIGMAAAGAAGIAAGIRPQHASAAGNTQDNAEEEKPVSISYPEDQKDLKARWERLDREMHSWWDPDLHRATEKEIHEDTSKTLIFLPFPYIAGGGSKKAFPEIYGWDTQFTNVALLEHDRPDIVRWNMLDQLFMIERFGKVLNGNRTYYLTRGQPPLLGWSVSNYLKVKKDDDELAMLAYPLLEKSYVHYWNAPGHSTPIGLSTCRDAGRAGSDLDAEEASECEAGLDFTPIFGGKITECVPIHVNCALIKQAQALAMLARRFGWQDKAAHWDKEAADRASRINQYCWDGSKGFYFEYNYVEKKQLPYYSLNGFWPLWAGIASKEQAKKVVDRLGMFNRPFGLTFTDRTYPNPHPRFHALEWAYPEAWPPQQIIVGQALERYGYKSQAQDVSRRYIGNLVTTWEQTGTLWERYNGVKGGHKVPIERAPPRPLHGFTSASAVVVGRIAFR